MRLQRLFCIMRLSDNTSGNDSLASFAVACAESAEYDLILLAPRQKKQLIDRHSQRTDIFNSVAKL